MTLKKIHKNQIDNNEDRSHWPARLIGTNINPETLLATDYLNHFNEVTMLMDVIADLPECLDDILKWQPKSYPDHFRNSSFPYKTLAIEAYGAAPAAGREALDKIVSELNTLILKAVADIALESMKQHPEHVANVAANAAQQLRYLISLAGGVINGAAHEQNGTGSDSSPDSQTMDQSDIDSLFD